MSNIQTSTTSLGAWESIAGQTPARNRLFSPAHLPDWPSLEIRRATVPEDLHLITIVLARVSDLPGRRTRVRRRLSERMDRMTSLYAQGTESTTTGINRNSRCRT